MCRVAPDYDEDYRLCGNFSVLLPLPDATGVYQPPYFGGDHYTFILRFEFFSHTLQAFCAFPLVPYQRDCVDL